MWNILAGTDDVAMPSVEPSSIEDELAERRGFTSEIFKMELNGIPKFFGVNQVFALTIDRIFILSIFTSATKPVVVVVVTLEIPIHLNDDRLLVKLRHPNWRHTVYSWLIVFVTICPFLLLPLCVRV